MGEHIGLAGKHSSLEIIFDTSKNGLLTLFKPYQAALMEHIWELNESERVGINSRQAYRFLQGHPDSKSRASVIFFLNDMVEEGIMTYEEQTGRGGRHKVYYPKMNKEQFAQFVVKTITGKLHEVFPEV